MHSLCSPKSLVAGTRCRCCAGESHSPPHVYAFPVYVVGGHSGASSESFAVRFIATRNRVLSDTRLPVKALAMAE